MRLTAHDKAYDIPDSRRGGLQFGCLVAALGLAASVLAGTGGRAAWAQPTMTAGAATADVGRELADRLRFRSSFDFLSTDVSWVEDLMLSGGNPEAEAMLGLELTDAEWEEMVRRFDLTSRMIPVMRTATGRAFDETEERLEGQARLLGSRLPTGTVFGGIWQDQMDGGRIKLAVTDRGAVNVDEILSMFPRGSADFAIIEQAYSLDQLYEWRSWILARKNSAVWGGVGFDYSDTGVRLRLVLYQEYPNADLERVLGGIPHDAVVAEFADAVPSDFGEPSATHADASLTAGLRIGVIEHPGTPDWVNGYCTWGASGHTSDYTYIVTAGHCMTPHASVISGWNKRAVEQTYDSGRIISTSGGAFTYGRNFDSSATLDHGRISSSAADTNCTHGSILNWLAHCTASDNRITRRLSLYGHQSGQVVCASLGATDDFNCGTVDDTDLGGFDIYRQGVGWVTVYNRITVNGLCAGPGDSGAGVVAGPTLHGILSGGDVGSCWTFFEPAYFVKAYMGATSFDFNCVESGSWWGACPVVYS